MIKPNLRPLLGCIADDFTGASDLANNLVRAGMRTIQTIGIPAESQKLNADAIVISLKSRTISKHEAIKQSLQAYEWLKVQGVEQFYFKYCSTFDSTPQGNIGPVTEALMDEIFGEGKGFTIVCPAFPEAKRTIFNGHLFVGNELLSESGMRNHPLTPMTDANLVRVMQAQTQRVVGLVNYDSVRAGPDEIRARFHALQNQGIGIAVVDVTCNQDLEYIALATADMPLVTAGSGLAIGLPNNWRIRGLFDLNDSSDMLPPASGYQAVISGSCSQASNAQVRDFCQRGLPTFVIDPLADVSHVNIAQQAIALAEKHLKNGPMLFYTTSQPDIVKSIQEKLGVIKASEHIEKILAEIAKGLVQNGVRQLVVAGGETSGAVVQALGIKQMTIGPQIDSGVPWMSASSPCCHDETIHLALKSGNFGSIDFFTKSFTQLSNLHHE